MTGGTGGSYEGSDFATGSQTPEGITTPSTDVFDSGIAGGPTNGEGEENPGSAS
ncbi:hypothetical protein [Flavisolibacter nicotianae]|uniref:hypothetical protein n=1 Tax=Flavisolibacter nicotianae TaxID=2364882 RepID=UPI0013C47580|nr:hypothetical protein [Flavisolibacter nicotianae]